MRGIAARVVLVGTLLATSEVAQAQPVITVTGYYAADAVGANGSLIGDWVGTPYGNATPHQGPLQISGGTPPYTLCGVTSTGTCDGPPGGTLNETGVTASIPEGSSQIVFSGTPTKAGGFTWGGRVYDHSSPPRSSNKLVLTVQIYDYALTEASIVPPNPQNYYYYGPDHCCVLRAVVSAYHKGSGSPAGTVSFYVDDHPEGRAALDFSYANVPNPTIATARSATTIDAGTHLVTAEFNSDPPPAGVCWPSYQDLKTAPLGPPRNCFVGLPHLSPYNKGTHFTVSPSPTETQLYFPAETSSGELRFAVAVKNDTDVTWGDAQVDPGTLVQLVMDGLPVRGAAVSVPLPGEPMPYIDVSPSPGKHSFVAEYLGDTNELRSRSSPLTLMVYRH